MTLEEFIKANSNFIKQDSPTNQVFGPSGMIAIFNLNKNISKKITIWYFHKNKENYYSLRSILVDDKGNVIKRSSSGLRNKYW
jgi:hypothetical protein